MEFTNETPRISEQTLDALAETIRQGTALRIDRADDHHWTVPARVNGNGNVPFEGGASRSELKAPYYLLEDCFLIATSKRMRKGELLHGRDNYKQGGPEFILETWNHFMAHLLALRDNDSTDDHMGALCANAQILTWHWTHKRENFRLLWGANSPPPEPASAAAVA